MRIIVCLVLTVSALTLASAEPPIRLHILRTSAGQVTSVAWSPDGKRVAAGTNVGLMHVWAAPAGGEPRVFRGGGAIRTLAWTPDGSKLKSVDEADQVRVWDLDNARVTQVSQGPDIRAAWSVDTEILAATYTGDHVWVWHGLSQRRPLVLKVPNRAFSLAWNSNARFLAVGTQEQLKPGGLTGGIELWEMPLGERRSAFAASPGPPSSLAWSPDGKLLAAVDEGTVHVLSPETGKKIAVLKAHKSKVNTMAWRPDGKWLVSVGEDRTVRIWSTTDWANWRTFDFDQTPSAVSWRSDGRLLAIAMGQEIHIWNPRDTEL